jgi:uncharacterized damage-inducible protein DinB
MVSTIDLMDFVHELRQDFFERAARLGWKEFTKDRGVSMLSFRELFLHLAYVEEQHVTEFCEGRPTPWMPEVMEIPKDRYLSIAAVRRRLREVRAMGDRRFRRWNTPAELAKPAVWVASKRYPLRLTRDSALAQCLTEQLLHLGEVEAMLWQMDVEPPTTFWIARRVLHGTWPPPRSALYQGRLLPGPPAPPGRTRGRSAPKRRLAGRGRRRGRRLTAAPGRGTRSRSGRVRPNRSPARTPRAGPRRPPSAAA